MKLINYRVWGNNKSTIADYIVSIFTLGKYSHTEIVFSDNVSFSISPRENIARFKSINYHNGSWDILEFKTSIEQERLMRAEAEKLVNESTQYDYAGALFSPLKLCIQKEEKIFCSEVCAYLLNKYNVFDLENGCRYTPSRLFNIIKSKI